MAKQQCLLQHRPRHYSDVIMGVVASQITSRTIVNSVVYSGAGQRKHQSSASPAFVRGIHRWPVNYPHKGPVTRKMFPFDDVIMAENQMAASNGKRRCTTAFRKLYFLNTNREEIIFLSLRSDLYANKELNLLFRLWMLILNMRFVITHCQLYYLGPFLVSWINLHPRMVN